jgi:hypothetical protein
MEVDVTDLILGWSPILNSRDTEMEVDHRGNREEVEMIQRRLI